MYWMAARLTSPDCALKAMPQNWSMPHNCLTKGKQTQKQNIASLFYFLLIWDVLFASLTQSLTISHFLHCLHCHHWIHQLLQNSRFQRNIFKVMRRTEIQNSQFSFLTNRNTFKWSCKTTTIISIQCKKKNCLKSIRRIYSKYNFIYEVISLDKKVLKHIIHKLRHILQQISSQN